MAQKELNVHMSMYLELSEFETEEEAEERAYRIINIMESAIKGLSTQVYESELQEI